MSNAYPVYWPPKKCCRCGGDIQRASMILTEMDGTLIGHLCEGCAWKPEPPTLWQRFTAWLEADAMLRALAWLIVGGWAVIVFGSLVLGLYIASGGQAWFVVAVFVLMAAAAATAWARNYLERPRRYTNE